MKIEKFRLSVLLLRPKAPGNDINVYSQPLTEGLIELWEIGISTHDASSG